MRKGIEKRIQQVFAILPEDRINEAVAATLDRLRLGATAAPPELRWADFDESGRLLRAGVSSLAERSTRLTHDLDADALFAELRREAADGGAQPGRVLRSPDGARLLMFLPCSASGIVAAPGLRVRGFVIDQAVFAAVHAFFNPGRGVTEAERRVLFQLMGGMALREAADLDGVTVETKRAQIKSAATKMQCGGQVDLVRTLMGQLVYVLAISDDESRAADFAERFVMERLGGEADLTVERLENGRLMRCIESGPRDGRAVVVAHGMMFGMLLSGARPYLEAEGLRLLTPLRRHYLDPRPVLGVGRQRGAKALEDLDDLAGLIERRGLAPACVLGHSLGSMVALRFAQTRPELVSKLALLSTNTARADTFAADEAARLYDGYRAIDEQPGFATAATLEFGRHYANEEVARTILHRMFDRSKADVSALEGDGAAAPVYGWFPELYATSAVGIARDYAFAMQMDEASLGVRAPALLIHGSEDPLTPSERIVTWTRAWRSARAVMVDGAGHFASSTHPEAVWGAIGAFFR